VAFHPNIYCISPHQKAHFYNIENLFPKHNHAMGTPNAPKDSHTKHVPSDVQGSFAMSVTLMSSSPRDDTCKCFMLEKARVEHKFLPDALHLPPDPSHEFTFLKAVLECFEDAHVAAFARARKIHAGTLAACG
jgi:hypothetical protein